MVDFATESSTSPKLEGGQEIAVELSGAQTIKDLETDLKATKEALEVESNNADDLAKQLRAANDAIVHALGGPNGIDTVIYDSATDEVKDAINAAFVAKTEAEERASAKAA